MRPLSSQRKITADDLIQIKHDWLKTSLNKTGIAIKFHVDHSTVTYHLRKMKILHRPHHKKTISKIKIKVTRNIQKVKSYKDYLEEYKHRQAAHPVKKSKFPANFSEYFYNDPQNIYS